MVTHTEVYTLIYNRKPNKNRFLTHSLICVSPRFLLVYRSVNVFTKDRMVFFRPNQQYFVLKIKVNNNDNDDDNEDHNKDDFGDQR